MKNKVYEQEHSNFVLLLLYTIPADKVSYLMLDLEVLINFTGLHSWFVTKKLGQHTRFAGEDSLLLLMVVLMLHLRT